MRARADGGEARERRMKQVQSRRWLGALTVLALLGGCASAPTGHPLARGPARSAQPLDRVNLPQAPADKDLLALQLAGDFALSQGDLAGATRDYLAATRLSGDPAVAEQAVRLAIAAKDWDSARAAQKRWSELKPGEIGLRQIDATLDIAAGDLAAAAQALNDLAQEPDGKGWRLIGQVLLGGSDKKVAGDLLEQCLKANPLPPDQAEIWIALSQLAFKLEHKALAQDLAEKAEKKFATAEALAGTPPRPVTGTAMVEPAAVAPTPCCWPSMVG